MIPALWVVLAAALSSRAAGELADIVPTNGFVCTVDVEGTVAQAVAIRAGKFVFAGSDEMAMGFVGGGTDVIDLQGTVLPPGFAGSYFHPGT